MEKICESCGALFRKPSKKGYDDWAKRRFCSIPCRNKGFVKEKHQNWKGGEIKKTCKICSKIFQVEAYREKTAKYCSIVCLNVYRKTEEWRKHLSTIQQRRVILGLHNSYNGGVTPINKKLRRSLQFKLWREAVFKRDDYTCQICKVRGGKLHPDHVKQFAYYPELRFEISNGRTLCEECHRRTPSWGRKTKINN